jgi:DNA-binding transcriptional LysR family regulator
MRGLNLDYLRTFVTVMELGSFSAAAARLGLTQPAVSLQIRQLEQRMGAKLIERIGRKAKPTVAGAELLSRAGQIEMAVSSALEAVAKHATGAVGRVRLGTGATACIFLLPPVLRELRRKYPNLEIVVTTGNTADIVKALQENSIDLGLVTLPVSGRMFEVTTVVEDEFVIVAPPDMPLPARVTATILSKKPVLLFEPGGNTRRIVDAWFARHGVKLKPIMSLGSVEAIKEMAAAGLGCAVLPAMSVRSASDRSRLAIRSLSPRLYRRLAVVIRRDKTLYRGLKETMMALKGLSKSVRGAGEG